MDERRFRWLAPSGFAGGGRPLRSGETYPVEAFGEDVVAEWIRGGAAEMVAVEQAKELARAMKPRPDIKARKGKE